MAPRARAQHRDSPPPPSQHQKPTSSSVYRVVVEAPRGTAPFGSIINDASLLLALNEFGPVFHLEVKSTICFVTFKSTATVGNLIAAKTLTINGIVCSTNYLVYNTVRSHSQTDPQARLLTAGHNFEVVKLAWAVYYSTRLL